MSVIKQKPVPSDIAIAQAAKIRPIVEVADGYGIPESALETFGSDKAKVRLEFVNEAASRPKRAKYVDVTAITPTP
ncbi:MAG: formate--tetrahydrofolate ligase, partial [Spirochaetia bacterium]|nr:formate--tetrahydrofolate ligase [Spirochaetia bacterium]